MKIYNVSLSRGKNTYIYIYIHIGKKEKKRPNSSYQLKKTTNTQLIVKRKKPPEIAAKLQVQKVLNTK